MTVSIGAPQIIWIIFAVLTIIDHTANHGKPRDPRNGGVAFLNVCLGAAILYWGGFFS